MVVAVRQCHIERSDLQPVVLSLSLSPTTELDDFLPGGEGWAA